MLNTERVFDTGGFYESAPTVYPNRARGGANGTAAGGAAWASCLRRLPFLPSHRLSKSANTPSVTEPSLSSSQKARHRTSLPVADHPSGSQNVRSSALFRPLDLGASNKRSGQLFTTCLARCLGQDQRDRADDEEFPLPNILLIGWHLIQGRRGFAGPPGPARTTYGF